DSFAELEFYIGSRSVRDWRSGDFDHDHALAHLHGRCHRVGGIAVVWRGIWHLQRRVGSRPSRRTGAGRGLVRPFGIGRALVDLGAGGRDDRSSVVSRRQIVSTPGFWVLSSWFWFWVLGSWFYELRTQNPEPRTWNPARDVIVLAGIRSPAASRGCRSAG